MKVAFISWIGNPHPRGLTNVPSLLDADHMNYNSFTFWALFAAVMAPYWFLNHKQQNRLLLVASYVFYGFWDYRFLFLVLISTYIDFIGGLGVAGVRVSLSKMLRLSALLVGSALLLCSEIDYPQLIVGLYRAEFTTALSTIPRNWTAYIVPAVTLVVSLAYTAFQPWLFARREQTRRVAYLVISLTANLGILAYFKYCDFFITSFRDFVSTIGWGNVNLLPLGILLPAGISFYTFQSMSYAIDIYRREAEPTEDFMDFALFVCFFPHLVAGPIMRAHTLLPQVTEPRRVTRNGWEDGLYLVLLGMFKKVVVADNLAPMANAVFNQYAAGLGGEISGAATMMGVYAFALQIYGDFSGYSSVARGISKWLGFELAINFRLPYFAVSPSDFWQRWHISLSSWLRDYLYIPLGGNRYGTWLTYRNLMITMLLGGMWHGAAWTFIAWGFYHGAILCLFRILKIRDPKLTAHPASWLHYGFRALVMFHLTCLGWLFFRADGFGTAAAMLLQVVRDPLPSAEILPQAAFLLFYCGPLFLLEWWLDGEERVERLTSTMPIRRAVAYAYLLISMLVFHATQASEFIYFQF